MINIMILVMAIITAIIILLLSFLLLLHSPAEVGDMESKLARCWLAGHPSCRQDLGIDRTEVVQSLDMHSHL